MGTYRLVACTFALCLASCVHAAPPAIRCGVEVGGICFDSAAKPRSISSETDLLINLELPEFKISSNFKVSRSCETERSDEVSLLLADEPGARWRGWRVGSGNCLVLLEESGSAATAERILRQVHYYLHVRSGSGLKMFPFARGPQPN